MLTVADRGQQGFFDASVCGSIVPGYRAAFDDAVLESTWTARL
jgi:hypothetical protein